MLAKFYCHRVGSEVKALSCLWKWQMYVNICRRVGRTWRLADLCLTSCKTRGWTRAWAKSKNEVNRMNGRRKKRRRSGKRRHTNSTNGLKNSRLMTSDSSCTYIGRKNVCIMNKWVGQTGHADGYRWRIFCVFLFCWGRFWARWDRRRASRYRCSVQL